jgi:antitoxin MazE
MGNSTGVIIPKPILKEIGAQAGDDIDLSVETGRIVLTAKKKRPREGWAEAAAAIVAAGEDGLVWPEFGNENDEDLIW